MLYIIFLIIIVRIQYYSSKHRSTKFSQFRMKKFSWFVVVFTVVVAVVLLASIGAIVGVHQAVKRSISFASDKYTPGDTRLHTFSSFFCSAVSLEVDNSTNASIHLVDTPPDFTKEPIKSSFSFTGVLDPSEYKFWQFYLHPTSTISIKSSIEHVSVDLYLIKGNENATEWSYFKKKHDLSGLVFSEAFHSFRKSSEFLYQIPESDEYYLVIDNHSTFSNVLVDIQISLKRYQYEIPIRENSQKCTASSANDASKCTVNIPYSVSSQNIASSQSVLAEVSVPANVSWTDGVDLSVNCVRRDWAYTVVIIFFLLVTMCIILAFVICVNKTCQKKVDDDI